VEEEEGVEEEDAGVPEVIAGAVVEEEEDVVLVAGVAAVGRDELGVVDVFVVVYNWNISLSNRLYKRENNEMNNV
jgi:hypothetical protein